MKEEYRWREAKIEKDTEVKYYHGRTLALHGGKDAIKRHWNDQAKRTAFVDVPIPQLSRDYRQPPSSDRVCHSARLKEDEGDIIL